MSMSQKQGLYRSALFLNTLLYRNNIPNIYQYMPIFPLNRQYIRIGGENRIDNLRMFFVSTHCTASLVFTASSLL